jgi:hypothetical protein
MPKSTHTSGPPCSISPEGSINPKIMSPQPIRADRLLASLKNNPLPPGVLYGWSGCFSSLHHRHQASLKQDNRVKMSVHAKVILPPVKIAAKVSPSRGRRPRPAKAR